MKPIRQSLDGSPRRWIVVTFFTCCLLQLKAADSENAGRMSDAEFFDPRRLLEVQITLAPADYEVLRHQKRDLTGQFSAAQEEKPSPLPRAYDWFKADVVIDGIALRQVRIRKRGLLGSVSSERPSFNIDVADGEEFAGATRLILHNNHQDPSQMQQFLGYKVLAAAAVPGPRCNLARVTVNGKDLGIYSHIEAVDKPFLKRHFGSSKGNLYEAAISDFRPGWVNTFEAKNNKKTNDRSDLDRLVKALEVQEGVVERVSPLVDIDAYLSFWAAEALIGHWDGYSGDQNNSFVYHDPKSGRFKFIAWGADSTFGAENRFAPFQPPVSVMAMSRLSRRLYNDAAIREQYRERMRRLLATAWNETELLAEVDRLEKVLRSRITIPKALFDKGVQNVREFIRIRRTQIESELARPASPWVYPDRTTRHRQTVGNITATFSTVWSSNFFGNEMTNFPSLHDARLSMEFYSRQYASLTARSRSGISLRHPTWAAIQILAPVEGVPVPLVLILAIDRDILLEGGAISLDGNKAIAYLLLNDVSQPWYRVLSWLSDDKASVIIERAGLKPGDEIRGSVSGSIMALPWDDFDLRQLGPPKSQP